MLTEQQLEWRRGGIGSSDAGVIAGHSLYADATPFSVWKSKVWGSDPETTDAMNMGNIFEEGISKWYAAEIGNVKMVKARGRVHRTRRWQRATPDYYASELGSKRRRIVECKWVGPGLERHWDPEVVDGIPAMVLDQVDWQMDVTGIREVDVAAIFPLWRRGHIWRIPYNEQRVAELREACKAFWLNYVVSQTPPPIDDSQAAADWLLSSYSQGQETVPAPVIAEDLAMQHEVWKTSEKLAAKQRELVANQIKNIIGDNAAILGRWGKASWLEQRGTVSWKAVADDLMKILLNHGTYPEYIESIINRHRSPSSRILRVMLKDNYEPQP